MNMKEKICLVLFIYHVAALTNMSNPETLSENVLGFFYLFAATLSAVLFVALGDE